MIEEKTAFKDEQLAYELWQLSEDAFSTGSPWTKEQFLTDIQQPQTNYLVVREENKIIGFLGYTRVLDEVEVTNLAVLTTEQQKGIARRLLQEMLQREKANQAYSVFLEVRQSNVAAQHLYESEKFRQVGKRKAYYHEPDEDAVIMCTKLKTEAMKH
ncbi:ribosomal protein S18-alanine N-acetyltransferase [Enterococcus sp. DIV1298c]|uniref:Ribosomal-protein-alanine acetyltransferase n=1 Tax=Candidatus Enterococcus mangumiae TaxID=2230878 RepID=A0ABZ2T045_9ENTE|nr:ribosomal protein S18-alanine N-acetyltransferase [Enterococcus sp. DIV1298c]MBO0490416.1 ribosomal protein S18-alanine N-acetyltransferase [Enterococcus sp. DIV1094]